MHSEIRHWRCSPARGIAPSVHICNCGVDGVDVPASERQVGCSVGDRTTNGSLKTLTPFLPHAVATRQRARCQTSVRRSDDERHDATARDRASVCTDDHLLSNGPASITELADAVAWHGFAVAGRASKSISDALGDGIRQGASAGTRALRTWLDAAWHRAPDPQTRDDTSPPSQLSLRGRHFVASQTP